MSKIKLLWKAKTEKQYLTQQHDIQMAIKTLQHGSFLRGPGLLQVETIQKYFAKINEKPKFKVHKDKITDFCSKGESASQTVWKFLLRKRALADSYYVRFSGQWFQTRPCGSYEGIHKSELGSETDYSK